MILENIRKALLGLLIRLPRSSAGNDEHWSLAMIYEMYTVESDFEAIMFGLGCLRAITMVHLRHNNFEPLLRWGLVGLIFSWAAAKAYLLIVLAGKEQLTEVLPSWMAGAIILAGLTYALSALSLGARRYALFGLFVIAALAINSAFFGFAQLHFMQSNPQSPNQLTWYLALISEEYFIWTAIVVGAVATFVLRNMEGVRLALKNL